MNALSRFFIEAKKSGFNVNSICIQSKDGIIFEGSNELTNVHSAAKTITSLAFALLLKEHSDISLDDQVISFFPEYSFSSNTDCIKIRDLLHMQSGKCLQSLLQKNNNSEWNIDWVKWFLEFPMHYLPGTKYYYSSHCCYMIGRIIEKISQEDVNDFLLPRFWEPLGIKFPFWDKCPQGYTNCAGNLIMSCLDLSKVGWVILNYGQYGSVQLDFVEDYLRNMCTDIVNSSDPFMWDDEECSAGYGYFLWKCKKEERYRIWGAGGNFSIMDFGTHRCVTVTATRDDLNWRFHNDQDLLRMIVNFFL